MFGDLEWPLNAWPANAVTGQWRYHLVGDEVSTLAVNHPTDRCLLLKIAANDVNHRRRTGGLPLKITTGDSNGPQGIKSVNARTKHYGTPLELKFLTGSLISEDGYCTRDSEKNWDGEESIYGEKEIVYRSNESGTKEENNKIIKCLIWSAAD